MDKFLVRKPVFQDTTIILESSKRVREEINLNELPADPLDRKRISMFSLNDRDKVRRAYLQRGLCQSHGHTFPQKVVGQARLRSPQNCSWSYISLKGCWSGKTEITTELLECMACLSPRDSFSSFNKAKLVRLAELYPSDFSETDRVVLANQLETFVYDMRSSIEFSNLKGIGCLAIKLIEMNKESDYLLVYKLIKLALVLPVSTASVERVFSAMKIVKTRLRSKMGDQWMNGCLVTYIEKEVFKDVLDEVIMKKYQSMTGRRCPLPRNF